MWNTGRMKTNLEFISVCTSVRIQISLAYTGKHKKRSQRLTTVAVVNFLDSNALHIVSHLIFIVTQRKQLLKSLYHRGGWRPSLKLKSPAEDLQEGGRVNTTNQAWLVIRPPFYPLPHSWSTARRHMLLIAIVNTGKHLNEQEHFKYMRKK